MRIPPQDNHTGRVFRNSLYVLLARLIDTGGGLLLIWMSAQYMVRQFGIETNGQYAFLVTLIGLVFTISNAGLAQIIIRDVARDKSLASSYLSSAMVLRVCFGVLAAIILMLIALLFPMERVLKLGILLAIVVEMGNVLSWNYINLFNAYERMDYEAVAAVIFRVLGLAVTGVIVFFHMHWLWLFVATGVGSFGRLAYVYWQGKQFVTLETRLDFAQIKYLFWAALPIGFALMMTQGYIRIDVILLKWMANNREVALFYYPYRMLLELHILPLALTTALFPVLARRGMQTAENSTDNPFEAIFIKAFKLYWVLSLFIIGVVFFYAKSLMVFFFTDAFASSGTCLQIMIWGVFFVFSELLMSHALIARGYQRVLFTANGACLITNILVDYYLIKYFHMGAIGASIGTLSSYAVLFLFLVWHLRKIVSLRKVFGSMPKPFFAAAGSMALSYLLQGVAWYRVVPLAILVFVLLIWLLNAFTKEEYQGFKKLLLPPGPGRPE